MATFQELAAQYAQKLQSALLQDNFNGKSVVLKKDLLRSNTYKALNEIKAEIDSLIYTESNQKLSINDKSLIIDEILNRLKLHRKLEKSISVFNSNDEFSELASTVEQILKGKG